jgi:hypothetical protein
MLRTVRTSARFLVTVVAVAAGVSVTVAAHHSFAMFDTAKPVTLDAVVTSFEWTNPHAYIEVDASDGRGGVRHWSIELGSTSILMRAGWKFSTLKKGDKVTAVVSPLRNGEPGSLLSRITLADGRVLANGGPAPAGVAPAGVAPRP